MESKCEAFYSREQWLKRMTDLRRTGGLPTKRLALHLNKERIRACPFGVWIHNQGDKLFVKMHLCGVGPELARPADKLEQTTKTECELVKEFNVER